MGIPLLHPWANRLSRPGYDAGGKEVTLPPPDGRYALDPNGLPIHGALPGLLRWEVIETGAQDRISARLDWSAPELHGAVPVRARAAPRRARGRCAGSSWSPRCGPPAPTRSRCRSAITRTCARRATRRARDWQVSLGASERLVLDDRMIPTGATVPLEPRRFALDGLSWDDGLAGLSSPPEFSVVGGRADCDRHLRRGL